MRSLFKLSKNLLKKVYILWWQRQNSRKGNVHLGADEAVLKRIPFSKKSVYLRPTSSDSGRVSEFLNGIYFSNSYLHDAVVAKRPKVLIDVGANIGLSSLSIVCKFDSIRKVIAIEAEKNNFGVLEKNFLHWGAQLSDIDFEAVNAIATSSSDIKMQQNKSLAELTPTGRNSASGTFRFSISNPDTLDSNECSISLSINELLEDYSEDDGIIIKIDIEGGEEHLLNCNTDWLSKVTFMTIEVHDRFHPIMLSSSRNLLKALVDNNFAIKPELDVLHCYPRSLFTD